MNKTRLKNILEDAKKQLTDNNGILINSPIIQQFATARKKIDKIAAKKNPLVREYINIHKEAEKNLNTNIGRMTMAMKNVAAQHMIYTVAIEMSTDENEKQNLKQLQEELTKHPAIADYGKYIEGLRYLSGEIYEVSPEVEAFFHDELVVPLQKHESKYEKYRLGFDEYVKRETQRLNKKEIEMRQEIPVIEKKAQEIFEKERAAGTLNAELLKALDEEIAIKNGREELEKQKETMEPAEFNKKSQELADKERANKLLKTNLIRTRGSAESLKLLNDKLTLENSISSIPKNKEKLQEVFLSPKNQEKLDEYQKVIAKMKARELYAKQATNYDGLAHSFIGGHKFTNTKKNELLFRDRHTPVSLCVAMMLMNNYKLEDIMNPSALLEEKKKIGQEYIKRREADDTEWYIKTMFDGAVAMLDAYEKYLKDHKEELKTEQDLTLHAGTFGALSMMGFDMFQELSYCRDADNGKIHKNAEAYNELQDKLCCLDGSAVGASPLEIKYDFLSVPGNSVVCEMRRQLRTKMFLEEIKKDNPDLYSVLLKTPEQTSADNQLITLPEIEELYGEDVDMNPRNLSKEGAKTLAYLQTMEFIEEKDIRYDIAKEPVNAKNIPEILSYKMEEGESMNCVVSRGGIQLMETNIPVRLDNYFKAIETKGMRGEASKNSASFNTMMGVYDKAVKSFAGEKTKEEKIALLKELRETALVYMNEKRAQKGYTTEKALDKDIDSKMLGKEKGASIFTSRGRDRYEFARNLIRQAAKLEYEYINQDKQKESEQITKTEQTEKESKEIENESAEM